MANIGSTGLFNLIKSLSKSEKGYFKKFIHINSPRGKNKYLRLFEVIDKQQKNEEGTILRKAKLNTSNKSNQLPNLKNYLYNLILKSLGSYYAGSDATSELKSQLQSIKIFYEKGLFSDCEKTLIKAKKIAERHENHEQLLELLNWENKIVTNNPLLMSKTRTFRGKEIHERYMAVLGILKNKSEYAQLLSTIPGKYRVTGEIHDKKDLSELRNFIQHPLLKDEKLALSNEAKQSFNAIYTMYYRLSGETQKALAPSQHIVKLIESLPERVGSYPLEYMVALTNLSLIYILLKDYARAFDLVQKMESLPQKLDNKLSEGLRALIFMRVNYMKTHIYTETCEFEKGIALTEKIEQGTIVYKNNMEKRAEITLYCNVSLLQFIGGNYTLSLAWLNKILNDSSACETRPDVYCFIKIFNLLVHYELSNLDLLDDLIKPTHQFLKKRKMLSGLNISILHFFQKSIPGTDSAKKRAAAFLSLKKQFEILLKDPGLKQAFEYFDFVSWAESKVQNRPLVAILKEKKNKTRENR
jgi:hypothetical protein